jgi:hypothetical protein
MRLPYVLNCPLFPQFSALLAVKIGLENFQSRWIETAREPPNCRPAVYNCPFEFFPAVV